MVVPLLENKRKNGPKWRFRTSEIYYPAGPPNCGGGFASRPFRPKVEHKTGLSLAHQPASSLRVHSEFSIAEISAFSATLTLVKPENR